MPVQKIYPSTSDIFDPTEVSVVDGAPTSLAPISAWSNSVSCFRFISSAYEDSGPRGLTLLTNQGTVTISYDATLARNVSVFNGSSNLTHLTYAAIGLTTPLTHACFHLKFNQDVTQSTDANIVNFYGPGAAFRFLLSGGYLYFQVFVGAASNVYFRLDYTKGVWHSATMRIDNSLGYPVLTCWYDGVFQVNTAYTTQLPYSGATNVIIVGSQPGNTQYFKGMMADFFFTDSYLTNDECLDINQNGPRKYKLKTQYILNTEVTDPQMSYGMSFSESRLGAGSLGYALSNDTKTTWKIFDGASWVSSPLFNSVTTVNDNVSLFDLSSKSLYVKVEFTSDGWDNPQLEFVQVGFALNSSPSILIGPASLCVKGNVLSPFNALQFDDVDNNITHAYYSVSPIIGNTEVFQGSFSTLLDAFRATSFATSASIWVPGTYTVTASVKDAFNVLVSDQTEIFVISGESSVTQVYDLCTQIDAKIDALSVDVSSVQSAVTVTLAAQISSILSSVTFGFAQIQSSLSALNAKISSFLKSGVDIIRRTF